jgi:glycosyltransferase involved in cell wall biosynthesis
MRILFVLGGLRVGGYEILSAKIAESFAKEGNKIAILSLGRDVSILDRIDPGVSTYITKRLFKFDVSVLLRIAIVLWRFNPDIILSCAFFEHFITRLASLMSLRTYEHLLAFHQTRPYDAKEDRWNHTYSLVSRLLNDRYVAIHKSQIGFFSRNYGLRPENFSLIHNGVDTDYFNPGRKRLRRGDGVFRIVHVANLKPLKDQLTLLKAMVELNKVCKKWDLTIVGADQSGSLQEHKDFVFERGISEKVHFAGSVSDTRSMLHDSDVFVLTSITEALPLSVIEAMATGLPCIVTNVGGNPDIIEDGVEGYLVEPGDYMTIARHLRYIIDKPTLRRKMGRAARAKAVAQFSVETMIDKYRKLFENIRGV